MPWAYPITRAVWMMGRLQADSSTIVMFLFTDCY